MLLLYFFLFVLHAMEWKNACKENHFLEFFYFHSPEFHIILQYLEKEPFFEFFYFQSLEVHYLEFFYFPLG